MARRKKKSSKKKPTFNPKTAQPNFLLGSIFLILAILVFVSLWDYHPTQSPQITTDAGEYEDWEEEESPGSSTEPIEDEELEDYEDEVVAEDNAVGKIGAQIGFNSFFFLGFSAWLIPLYLLWASYMNFYKMGPLISKWRWGAVLVSLISFAAFSNMLEVISFGKESVDLQQFPNGWGGLTGNILFERLLSRSLGTVGSNFIILILFLGSSGFLFYDNIARVGAMKQKLKDWKIAKAGRKDTKRLAIQAELKAKTDAKKTPPFPFPGSKRATEKGTEGDSILEEDSIDSGIGLMGAEPLMGDDEEPPLETQSGPGSVPQTATASASPVAKKGGSLKLDSVPTPTKQIATSGLKIIASEPTKKAETPLPRKRGDYNFPPLDLLESQDVAALGNYEEEDHLATAEALVRTLSEFGVNVSMGEVHTGPVITRFDVYPAAGVRVEKILNLDKNIALGLKATSVRILAPVPGKGCVGIEVPNRNPSEVRIRDIIDSADWTDSNAIIPIALGKEVSGKPLVADLTKMPHLLIAGATGSGKTVCINSIIASLLYHASPEDVRFIMVDPKIVELQAYNDLPHMMIPVVTDPKKVPAALKYLLKEMENRYKTFAKISVRNIAGFNAKRAKDADAEKEQNALEAELTPEERAAVDTVEVPRDDEIEIPKRLPYIVCIVDELADLMMVAPADIETCVSRLAQLSRAAGIHLIISTQRPSVNVITGVIKANLTSRIAFKVAAKVDSRTILDQMGADHLIGRGDMLFLPPGAHSLLRAQGAFVSDEEINAIVDFLKQNGPPKIDETFQKHVETAGDENSAGGEDDDDELLPDAMKVIQTTKRASTSMLQRRLRIGYNRAARIMEMLEDRGIVGPENGAQPREILTDLDSI
jgi:S-DNA-T family DNA segregation ATPase FtsK/SpoIIIE